MAKQTRRQKKVHALLNREGVHKVPETAGIYRIFNKDGMEIYVGVARKSLRHRLGSYIETDDFGVHPTKAGLRRQEHSFTAIPMPIDQARNKEETEKQHNKFNADSKINEAKKK